MSKRIRFRSLTEALQFPGELGGMVRSDLRVALSAPHAWPTDPTLAARAAAVWGELGSAPPPRCGVGDVCLVSMRPADGLGVLWRIRPAANPRARFFNDEIRASLALARLRAQAKTPLFLDPHAAEPALGWEVEFVYSTSGDCPPNLEGRSYELSLCLAEVSRLLGVPVPSDVVASALVREDGQLELPGGLDRKAEAIARGGLGLMRFLIGPSREPGKEKRRLEALFAGEGRPEITVLELASLDDAIAEVFGIGGERGVAALTLQVDWAKLVPKLFGLALVDSRHLNDWSGVIRTARQAARQPEVECDPDLQMQARYTELIACRHQGATACMEWPDDGWLSRQVKQNRLHLIAHLVQSAADSNLSVLADYVARASRFVTAPPENSAGDLVALGALGRAQAAGGLYASASALLRDVVENWFALHRPADASIPVCELLRLDGIRGDVDGVEHALAAVARIEASLGADDKSKAYLSLAAGRALVQLQQPRRALGEHLDLTHADWSLAPSFAQSSRARWLARAQRAVGDRAGAATSMEHLVGLRDPEQYALALLDLGLETGDGVERATQALFGLDATADQGVCAEALRLAARLTFPDDWRTILGDSTRLRQLADEFRY